MDDDQDEDGGTGDSKSAQVQGKSKKGLWDKNPKKPSMYLKGQQVWKDYHSPDRLMKKQADKIKEEEEEN
jgi:hypothetical protein